MSTEYKYQPFIAEFGEEMQKGVIRRPYIDKIGWDKGIRIYAKLGKPQLRVEMDFKPKGGGNDNQAA